MSRAPTVCQACGFPSYNGRVCKGCRKFYGGSSANAIAAADLARKMGACKTLEEIQEVLFLLVDFVVPMKMTDLHPLVHNRSTLKEPAHV